MDILVGLSFLPFSSFPPGTVYEIIKSSYSLFPALLTKEDAWIRLDNEIYSTNTHSDIGGFIAALDNEPVGVILWQIDREGETATITQCSISLSHQKKGYGSAMLEEAIRRLSLSGIKSIESKTYQRFVGSCRLFDKHNFTFVSLSREEDLSLGLGVGVNYLHIIGKKLQRPKKLRKKWNIF